MLEFNDNKPIYRQITDYAFSRIIEGDWQTGSRIPSVRELASSLGVNSRTILKAFEDLQDNGLITPLRGMGYILADDARDKVLSLLRKNFLEKKIPELAEEMKRLGILKEDLFSLLP